jgi:hypothetical protein
MKIIETFNGPLSAHALGLGLLLLSKSGRTHQRGGTRRDSKKAGPHHVGTALRGSCVVVSFVKQSPSMTQSYDKRVQGERDQRSRVILI